MVANFGKSLLLGVAAICILGQSSVISAAPARTAKDAAAIDAHFKLLTEMMAKGEAASKIVDEVYWPDAISSIEGMDTALRGHAQLTPLMQASVKEGVGTKCNFTYVGPMVIVGKMASSLGNVTCRDLGSDKDMASRALYVWEKRQGHWRIIREHVAMGNLK